MSEYEDNRTKTEIHDSKIKLCSQIATLAKEIDLVCGQQYEFYANNFSDSSSRYSRFRMNWIKEEDLEQTLELVKRYNVDLKQRKSLDKACSEA